MTKVTKESLAWRIARLEHQKRIIGLAAQEEYNLEAYVSLLGFMVGAVRARELINGQR